jgi:hypothetical protein
VPRSQSKCCDLKGNIIDQWPIALRVRASPVRSAGLGWSSDSHPRLDRAMKNSERVAPRQSAERNLNSRRMRREFSRYPYHSLSGVISTVQNCAKIRRGNMLMFLPPLGR